MKKRMLILLAVVLSILLLAACSNALVGQWRSTKADGLVFTFEGGGKFTMYSRAQHEWSRSGAYKTEGSKLILNMEDGTVELDYRIEKDVLHITGGDFDESLNRVKNVAP